MTKIRVPRCMSTQHPDNVTTPFFSDNEVMSSEAEVKEAFFVFSQLGCTEQMWDSEGKEVDDEVVEKLLSNYTEFFRKKILGKDLFLTYRTPNPSVQKEQGKILLETLHSIPRAFDAAKIINGDVPPVFEVILPMTTSYGEIERIRDYYEKVIIGKKNMKLGDKTIKEWVGDFQPETINVIPLFEDHDSFLNSAKIVKEFIEKKKLDYQRVFLARSDPALNYGSVSAVLLAKIALFELDKVQDETNTEILPILGVGGAPFRGNFRPDNVDNCGVEYPSVQTFTVQSSFKYDHSFKDVAKGIETLNNGRRRKARSIDSEKAMELISKIKEEYQKQIAGMADTINMVAKYVPAKRKRKLHVGLFGYARSLKGISLPRAIKFCAAFYSIGVPPELLGLNGLNEKEFDELHDMYIKVDDDLADSVKWLNKNNLKNLPKSISEGIEKVMEWVDYEENNEYCEVTERILNNIKKGNDATLAEDIKHAAWMRKFLG